MRRVMSWQSLVCASWLALAVHVAHASPPGADVIRAAAQSVVQVRARQCGTANRSGTGFIWPQADQAVTASHVVGGCSAVAVYFEGKKIERRATIIRHLPDSDLALLRIEGAPKLPVLQVATRVPELTEDLTVLGYELGAPTMGSKSLRVSYGESTLEDMVPETVRRELAITGSPSLQLRVLRLEGHLLPGLSGAPVIDARGSVVAIGDGGLENGAASISWALPASKLGSLTTAAATPIAAPIQNSALFSADLTSRSGASAVCGQHQFTKMRTRSLSQLLASADDPVGLMQLVATFGAAQAQISFDIYVHKDSGATLVLPTGTTLQSGTEVCRATSPSGNITVFAQGVASPNQWHMQNVSVAFEQTIDQLTPFNWMLDPQWTYFQPQQRFDGLVVRRKAFVGATEPDLASGSTATTGYAFGTLFWRPGTFAAIAAVRSDAPAPGQVCAGFPFPCLMDPRLLQEWAAFALGVQLSTFPLG